jgi:membrane protein required for colicin V production
MVFDIVVLVVALASTLFAFFRGFIREVLTIFGVVGGSFGAYYLGPQLSPIVSGWIGADITEGDQKRLFGILPYDLLSNILSYGLIFIIIVILLSVISHMLASWAKAIGLGVFDRILGIFFGLVRALVLLAILYLPVYLITGEEGLALDDCSVSKESEKPIEGLDWFNKCALMAGSKSHIYIEKSSAWLAGFMPETSDEDIEKAKSEAAKVATKAVMKIQEIKEDAETAHKDENKQGYVEQERDDLDQLIEETIDE